MRIGVPTEIKNQEHRVGLTRGSVLDLAEAGHQVLVQAGAGLGIGVTDQDYVAAGATILPDAASVFGEAEMIVKVKEPLLNECAMLREGQLLFTYLHLAAAPETAKALQDSGCTAIAYETVTADDRSLPLLVPMSEVAGRMSVQVGAWCLQKANQGSGMLLGGIPGVPPARVVVLGGGVAGTNAAEMAVGLGAHVTIVDKSVPRLRQLAARFGNQIETRVPSKADLDACVLNADLVVGSVLIPGAAAPKLVTAEMVKRMRPGSAMVDISIDQGGCFETSRPTTHDDPIYVQDDVVHYCVTNMPGAVARTSAFGLNNCTLPFVHALAGKGWQQACRDDKHLANGLNVHAGKIMHEAVARDLGETFHAFDSAA